MISGGMVCVALRTVEAGTKLQGLSSTSSLRRHPESVPEHNTNLHALRRCEERGESSNFVSDILKLSGLNSFSFSLLRYLPVVPCIENVMQYIST